MNEETSSFTYPQFRFHKIRLDVIDYVWMPVHLQCFNFVNVVFFIFWQDSARFDRDLFSGRFVNRLKDFSIGS